MKDKRDTVSSLKFQYSTPGSASGHEDTQQGTYQNKTRKVCYFRGMTYKELSLRERERQDSVEGSINHAILFHLVAQGRAFNTKSFGSTGL